MKQPSTRKLPETGVYVGGGGVCVTFQSVRVGTSVCVVVVVCVCVILQCARVCDVAVCACMWGQVCVSVCEVCACGAHTSHYVPGT